jgi:fructokinase
VSQPPALYGAIEGGGTKFICALGTPDGKPLAQQSLPTTDPAATLAACSRFFETARDRHGAIAALGIACFGPLQLQPGAPDYGHLLATPKPGWSGFDIVGSLRDALGVPVVLDTDVGAAALAEWRLGAGRGHGSLVYVTVGTGIGAALVPQAANSSLMHAEMGHVPLRRDARDAGFAGTCPFHGDCAEGLASGPAIRARWGCELAELEADHPGHDIIAGYLGQLAAAITLMLAPGCIVFGGGVMGEGSMLPRVRKAMHGYLDGYLAPLRDIASLDSYLRAPGLGPQSGIRGALLLASGIAVAEYK